MHSSKAPALAVALAMLVAAPAAALAGEGSKHGTSASAKARDADDTGKNVRDRDEGSVTPMDQSNAEGDVAVTAEIRREIVADDSLSTNAKNVKIVTAGGKVTLRGPVKSAKERERIVASAKRAAKERGLEIDDQLEVERHD